MTKTFIVNYGQGNIVQIKASTLEEALQQVEAGGLPYTQESVKVYCNGKLEAIADWYGVAIDEDELDEDTYILEVFGDWGYYTNWRFDGLEGY